MNINKIAQIAFVSIIVLTFILLIFGTIKWDVALICIILILVLLIFIRTKQGVQFTFTLFGQSIKFIMTGQAREVKQNYPIPIQKDIVEESK
jgi:hypothetical protein